MILEAFYRSSTAARPMDLAQMAGYVWLGQAALALFPTNVDADIRDSVQSGTVVYELCRPLDLYGLWYSRALAWRTAPTLLRLVPMFLIAMLVLPVIGLPEWQLRPPGLLAGACWLVSMSGALLLSSAITTLMNISLLWTVSGQGFVLVSALASLLGGMVIPLPLFPDWAQPIVYALPFAGVMDLPGRLYTASLPAGQIGWVLGHQLAWTLVLVAGGRALLARGQRRLVVQGG
jgi:ABC-2 type transport system permease protein